MTLLDRFKQIKTFVFDVDGVLTDGSLLIFEGGQFIRKMNIKDGYAIALAVKKGYRIAVISGSKSDPVITRLNHLGVTDVFMEVQDKKAKLGEYIQKNGLSWNETLFMGDDIPDYEAMQMVGMSCAPADAVSDIKEIANYISIIPGGMGCVRDVIEKVLKLNDHWEYKTDVASR